MITIKRGSETLTVTRGAYKSMFASQGWEIVTTPKTGKKNDDFSGVSKTEVVSQDIEETPKKPVENLAENDEEDSDDIDYSEIPLSEMSVPQLQGYAEQLGLDFDTNSAKLLRNRIKKALSEG